MRSKSVINVKNFLAAAAAGAVAHGEVIAESYWRQTAAGDIEESQPSTSQILDQIFWPLRPSVDRCRVYINKLFTGLIIEEVIDGRGVHTERIVNNPLAADINDDPDFIHEQTRQNFRKHWSAND